MHVKQSNKMEGMFHIEGSYSAIDLLLELKSYFNLSRLYSILKFVNET